MADIYCRCGEPWDNDELHEWVAENYDDGAWTTNGRHDQTKYEKFYDKARAEFRKKGCEMFGSSHSNSDPARGEVFTELFDIMDTDGAIAMMEDAEYIGLFD